MAIVKLNILIGNKVELHFRTKSGKSQLFSKIINIVSENTFDLMIPEEILGSSYIAKDAVIDIVIIKEEAIFKFSVIVLGKVNDNITVLRVKINSEISKIQRRNFYRLEVINNFIAREVEDIKSYKFGEAFKGNIMDISGGGALIHINKDLKLDIIIELSFKISKERELVLFGMVLRKSILNTSKYAFEYGIKFINITEFDKNIVMKYIFEEQRKLIKKGLV